MEAAAQRDVCLLRLRKLARCDLPLIECLVGGNGHHDFVADTQEQEPTLWQIKRHLADDLVEALREKLFADGANPTLSRLALHQLLVEHLAKTSDIDSRGGLVTHVLDPVLAYFKSRERLQNG